jgi:plastocyanin
MPSWSARLPRPVAPALAAAAALAAAGAAIAGCGADPVTIESRTLQVRLTEYRLEPQDVRVRAGRLRIVAVNRGRLTHNVRLEREDPDDRERPGEELGGTRTSQPGDDVSGTIANLPPGEYRMFCSIANHDDLGMYGTLTAVAGEAR